MSSHDAGTISTASDASVSKLCCIQLGYYQDEFVHYFVPKAKRNPPIINRGYYTRVAAIAKLRDQFLAAGGDSVPKQIVCLGAGMDTSFFMLKKNGKAPKNYVEVDFAQNVTSKISTIQKHGALAELLQSPVASSNQTELHSEGYHLVSVDIRDVPTLEAKLTDSGIDFTLPTLFLSECVLIYMSPQEGDAIIQWAAHRFDAACFVTYEQIGPHDRFGETMIRNLKQRGISLASFEAYPDLMAQVQRYLTLGFTTSQADNLLTIYNQVFSKEEQRRIGTVEFLDELEEWSLIQEHYCVVYAAKHTHDTHFWQDWGLKQK